MLVEFLGLPGSGKSTLIRALIPALRAQGVAARRADKLAGLPSIERDAPRYLGRGPDRTTLYRTTRFRREHRGLMKHVEHKLSLSQTEEFLFTLTTGLYQTAREYGSEIGPALLDEGFVHRGVSAHLECEDALFQRYLGLIPVPELVVHLTLPVEAALSRAVARRAHKADAQQVHTKLGDRAVFARRDALFQMGVARLRERGATVFDVATEQSLDACVAQLTAMLHGCVSGHLTAAE